MKRVTIYTLPRGDLWFLEPNMVLSLGAVFAAITIRALRYYDFLELKVDLPDMLDAGICSAEHSADMDISRSSNEEGDFPI